MSAKSGALLPVYDHISYPFSLLRAKGSYVFDEAERGYLDLYGGHCVCSIGHSAPELVAAISKQAEEFIFYSNLAEIPIRQRAAKSLLDFGANYFSKAFFCNSGAEANENALKIAIKATGRKRICAFKGAFHGRTLLSMRATDNEKWHKIYFEDGNASTLRIRPNEESDLSLIDDSIAAVILEPIQSIGGVTCFERDYLLKLQERSGEVGALLIFDEVQTGIGRTGDPFVSGFNGFAPDMMTLAKGLAGGMPIGAVALTSEVARTVEAGDVAATFGGAPVVMAALIATIDYMRKNRVLENVADIENYIRDRLSTPETSGVLGVLGRGLLLGLLLGTEAKVARQALFERGIIVGLCSNPKVLHLLPPLNVSRGEIDEFLNALRGVLGS